MKENGMPPAHAANPLAMPYTGFKVLHIKVSIISIYSIVSSTLPQTSVYGFKFVCDIYKQKHLYRQNEYPKSLGSVVSHHNLVIETL